MTWALYAIAVVVAAAFALLISPRRGVSPKQVIDGRAVMIHCRLVDDRKQPMKTIEADIDVELGPEDVSFDPQYVLARRTIDHPPEYSVLRGGVHYSLRTKDRAKIDQTSREMVQYARTLAETSRRIRDELFERAISAAGLDRERAVRDLVRQFPKSKETRRAAEAAVLDDHPPTRLVAAIYLDDDGLGTVEDIARDDRADPQLRITALRHLARAVDQSRFGALLEGILAAEGDDEVRETAVAAYADMKGSEAIDHLAAMLDGANVRIAAAIARALGAIRDPVAEASLSALLDRRDAEVMIAAARALGRIGAIAQIPRLVELARIEDLDEEVKEVLEAVAAVLRDVSGPAESGRLSLIEPIETRGSLSLSADSGAVSLAARED